jgi:UDP-N-acetyl-D-mannosaminuronic acid dehydrogenase
VQGNAFEELKTWPQIVSAFDERTLVEVANLFSKLSSVDIVAVKPIEAELAKLFTNAWRYIRFAVANEFFMIADSHGLDYHRIHEAMCREYPRNKDLPRPGFAAGPCLFKDTMQLAAFTNNNFWIGHAAMLINEGLSNYLVTSLRQEFSHELRLKTLGILGMAFKAESDDSRSSLSYRLKKIAQIECKKVLCTDPYIADSEFTSLEETLAQSDIILLATPHDAYRSIDPRQYPHKKFVDVWNFWGISR